VETRKITANELEVLRAWVAHDVPGATELRDQLSELVEVFSSCDCGCSSIGFKRYALSDEGGGVSIFDVDAEIVDNEGRSVGGMMLLIRTGRLDDVDVHSWFDELPFPALTSVRWHPRSKA